MICALYIPAHRLSIGDRLRTERLADDYAERKHLESRAYDHSFDNVRLLEVEKQPEV